MLRRVEEGEHGRGQVSLRAVGLAEVRVRARVGGIERARLLERVDALVRAAFREQHHAERLLRPGARGVQLHRRPRVGLRLVEPSGLEQVHRVVVVGARVRGVDAQRLDPQPLVALVDPVPRDGLRGQRDREQRTRD